MRDALFEPDDTPQTTAGAVTLSSVGVEVRSHRLVLRPLTIEDARWLGPESSKPVINRMTSRVPADNPPLFAELFILTMGAREQIKGDMVRAICNAETGAPVGVIGLHPHDQGWELGYWICEAAWGQGYASEAAAALCNWARQTGRTPLTSSHFIDNPASGRVLEKTGFAYTGQTLTAFSFGRMARQDVRLMTMTG